MVTKTAFLFAGQGSQYIGMGADLFAAFNQSKAVFEQANQVLGFDLAGLCFSGKAEDLQQTQNCQPAVLTVTVAALEAFRSTTSQAKGIQAGYVAGLSLGEYSALVAAGALEFRDALLLVRKRAELMQAAAKKYPGTMAALIGLDKEKVKEICRVSGRVEIANLNCPGQVVISGEKPAVEAAEQAALAQGAKRAVDLEVSGAFHSSLMQEAAMEFKDFLQANARFTAASIPVVSNVDALAVTQVSRIKENLVRQISSPVLWEDSMRFLLSQGVSKFYEFGPGKVLKGLMRKIEPAVEVVSIEKKEDILLLH